MLYGEVTFIYYENDKTHKSHTLRENVELFNFETRGIYTN